MHRPLIALILILSIKLIITNRETEPNTLTLQFTEQHRQYIKDSINQPNLTTAQIYLEPVPLAKDIMGITIPLATNKYLILISPNYPDQEHTVQHELVHVKQMHTRALVKQADTWYWQEEPIDWQEPYEWRPWEQLAELEARLWEFEYQLRKAKHSK